MNGPDILKELVTILKDSGWLDKATDYMRGHPERFAPMDSGGFISSIGLSVSFQPEKLRDIQNVKPLLFTQIGNIETVMNSYNEYDTGSKYTRTWFNSELISEVHNED